MSSLSRSLVTPNKLASVLDWRRKAIMALDITESQVGICIGGHPSSHGDEIHRLDPIRLHSGKSSHVEVAERIDGIARKHNVCAVVVGWPLQPEGNPGKPCGKVLHTLENLVEQGKRGIVSKGRPFTLWDDRHAMVETSPSSSTSGQTDTSASNKAIENFQPPDQWGRCVAFARAPTSRDGETYRSQAAYQRREIKDDRSEKVLQHFLLSFYDQSESTPGVRRSNSKVDYRKVTNDSWDYYEEKEAFL